MARALPSGILCMRCAAWKEEELTRITRRDLDLGPEVEVDPDGSKHMIFSSDEWMTFLSSGGTPGRGDGGPKVRKGARVRSRSWA